MKEARIFWISRRLPFMRMTPHRLVFVDETSTNTKMTRLRGRALCGNRLRALAPFGRWGMQTFIAGLRLCGLTAVRSSGEDARARDQFSVAALNARRGVNYASRHAAELGL